MFEKEAEELEKEKCELLGIIQGKDKVIQELEKENTELRNIAEFGYNKANERLTKAKELIKKFLRFVNNEVVFDPEHPQEHTDLWNELCEQAGQFINEVEK